MKYNQKTPNREFCFIYSTDIYILLYKTEKGNVLNTYRLNNDNINNNKFYNCGEHRKKQ